MNSSNFELLHEKVRRLLWQLNWDHLRDIQEEAIPPVLAKTTDVIISAPTAAGKTEAAFLPILSDFTTDAPKGLGCLYISPLKALINDQFDRLGLLCDKLEISIHEWHGDVNQSQKKDVINNPSGILLITPESLEALFINRGHLIPTLFGSLRYIVVDELHSFIGSERGKQLQSLLRRIEIATKRTIPRLALSATLGDLDFAAKYLRPEENFPYKIIQSQSNHQEIKLQLRGYVRNKPIIEKSLDATDDNSENESEFDPASLQKSYGDKLSIAEHILKTFRGSNNLIFANSRSNTEQYADLLRILSERDNVPNEFFPHHGSLSKELREDVEYKLKNQTLPISAVCTSTLELGIDIGSVKSIAQIGCPPSVSSMRQRLGRSGRRGEPAVMRIYIQENEITSTSSPLDCLRSELVESIALINLLIKGWYEKPTLSRLHFSTFIQQILSLLTQYGSLHPKELWQILCEKNTFLAIDKSVLAQVLKCLGDAKVIQQSSDGSLVLDLKGERIVGHYSFYAAFTTPQEYQIYNKGKLLGTIPINIALAVGLCIIFGGRRWKIAALDQEKRIIEVERSKGGKPPSFGGEGGAISKEAREEMRNIYLSTEIPPFLDHEARLLLAEGRDYFARFLLGTVNLLEHASDVILFHWDSDTVGNTILLQLKAMGLEGTNEGFALHFPKTSLQQIQTCLNMIGKKGFESDIVLVASVLNKEREKYDRLLTENLLNLEYASRSLDTKNAKSSVDHILGSESKSRTI